MRLMRHMRTYCVQINAQIAFPPETCPTTHESGVVGRPAYFDAARRVRLSSRQGSEGSGHCVRRCVTSPLPIPSSAPALLVQQRAMTLLPIPAAGGLWSFAALRCAASSKEGRKQRHLRIAYCQLPRHDQDRNSRAVAMHL